MQPSDWISSGALVVAIIALVFSVKSASAAQASANAAESSAEVAMRQHAHTLARDGIFEFGPWRVEAFRGMAEEPCWRFINASTQVLHELVVVDYGAAWNMKQGEEVEPGWFAIGALPEGYTEYRFSFPVDVSWREGSPTAPKITTRVWVRSLERN